MCYTILHDYYETTVYNCLVIFRDNFMRGSCCKLYKCCCTVIATKHYFINRIVNIWNSLPNHLVTAPSLISFCSHLAKFN